ncbi:MAG: glycosyltransferase [Bacteroidales bacterium]|nr:glycosyltransferase [Bacteroidales bacterium]
MNKRKIKVVWLCHLNNKLIEERLKINQSKEFAPWISRLIEIFNEYSSNVELHIVAPYWPILTYNYFVDNNIHYHFFPYRIVPGKSGYSCLIHVKTNYLYTKSWIRKIVEKICPDIIHLFGFENPRYSSGVFQLKDKYPVVITVQGFASAQYVKKLRKAHIKRLMIEQQIIMQFKYFGVRNTVMKDFISFINQDPIFFQHEIPVTKPDLKSSDKINKYDFVFFARVCKDKGIEDLIKSLAIIKKSKNNVSLCIIGQLVKSYKQKFYDLISEFKLNNNITYKGELQNQNDVHRIALTAKISVLPTLTDTIPGTILESMFMKIPCVSYTTGSIPSLNEHYETIKLVERGSIKELAKQMDFLLDNPDYSSKMADKAYEYVSKRWDDKKIYNDIKNIYSELLNE